jgi:hypothetical protein
LAGVETGRSLSRGKRTHSARSAARRRCVLTWKRCGSRSAGAFTPESANSWTTTSAGSRYTSRRGSCRRPRRARSSSQGRYATSSSGPGSVSTTAAHTNSKASPPWQLPAVNPNGPRPGSSDATARVAPDGVGTEWHATLRPRRRHHGSPYPPPMASPRPRTPRLRRHKRRTRTLATDCRHRSVMLRARDYRMRIIVRHPVVVGWSDLPPC